MTPALALSYAVFVATLNPATGQAVGGVAGSAFFVSSTKAITAFHVLQPKSFANSHTQVWLVHEGEPAIELRAESVTSESSKDKTEISLGAIASVKPEFIFQVGSPKAGDIVHTDGFLANSVGPILQIDGTRLRITSVPHLSRLHAEGHVMRELNVQLTSNDVNLRNAPCVQLSYKPVIGLSGGPVVTNNRVVGMNSFADPEARSSTWAVSIKN